MLFLDALYRDAAGRAGITYLDIWDGLSTRFLQKGSDFEGQIRHTSDGVYFTKPGARKLAHSSARSPVFSLRARGRLRYPPVVEKRKARSLSSPSRQRLTG
jgi:uncharacterized protein